MAMERHCCIKHFQKVFQLQITKYFCEGHKIQNTLNVFKIHVFQLLVFQLLQHCGAIGKFK